MFPGDDAPGLPLIPLPMTSSADVRPMPAASAAPGDPGDPDEAGKDEWLWGWDPTPGIVSVWAEADGRATVWRRSPEAGELVREEARFRPWILLDRLDDLVHLGPRLAPEDSPDAPGALAYYRELEGPG